MNLYNRSRLKQAFKTVTLSTDQKFSILIDSTYNKIEDSFPLGPSGSSFLLGPSGGTYNGLYIGSDSLGSTGKVLILDDEIQIYNTDLQTWITLVSTSTLASNNHFSSSDIFTLRYGKDYSLGVTELTGIKFSNYNGTLDGGIYLNHQGEFLLDNGIDTNYIALREENPIDRTVPFWSSLEKKYLSSSIYVDTSGFIGIGTQNPDQKLAISGNLKVSGSIYDSKNSPGLSGEVLFSSGTGTDWKLPSGIYGVTGTGLLNHIVKWTDYNSIEASSIVEFGSTVSIGPSSSTDLVVSGKIKSNGIELTYGPEVDQVQSFTKLLILTGEWEDVGINGTDLQTGTYIIQLYANDSWQGGSNNNEYYSGIMSWYSGEVMNPMELPTDEVTLHRSGGGSDGGLYLRTYKYLPESGPGYIKLQIYSNYENVQASNYVFKFRRML